MDDTNSPWEALDLDDSDITSSFSLRRCSTNKPLSLSSHPPQPPSQPPQQPPRAAIPGPAGAIQAAMHRKTRFDFNDGEIEISTQEYIRRVEEDSGEEFRRNPWVFALDVLRCDGFVDDVTTIRDVKKCGNAERIDKVVAIVKSCKPNGLGDMMVTLKDPTDTIGASVHRKVFSVGDFGTSIAVGSVLVLQKVVVFSSSCASCYLNITRSNLVKVISVDCGIQSFPEANALATPGIPDKSLDLISARTEEIIGDAQQRYNFKGKAVIEQLTGKETSTQRTSWMSSKQINNAAKNISKEHINIDSGPIALGSFKNCREGDNSCRSVQPGHGTAEGMAWNLEDCDNADKEKQVKDFSSTPCIIENLDSQHALRGGAQIGRLLRGNSRSMAEKLNVQVDSLTGKSPSMGVNLNSLVDQGANNVQNPSMTESLASQDIHKQNSQKRKQLTDAVTNVSMNAKEDDQVTRESNEVKKLRPVLISRASVQEWTDEQLGILDVDDD